jgi:predicted GNAT family N-acyltransferase
MENMNRRIANHGLEATPKGAHQAHVGNEDDHGCSRSGCEGFNESGTGLKTRMANIRLQPGKTDGFAGSSGARIIRAATWSDDEQSIRAIRTSVFVMEQNVPAERDFDGLDASCRHALAFAGDRAVATGRMEPDGHIGRIAVLGPNRGCGIGSAVVKFFVDMANRNKVDRVYLNAQTTAVGFYERLGFRKQGDVFMDAGIEHVRMEREP